MTLDGLRPISQFEGRTSWFRGDNTIGLSALLRQEKMEKKQRSAKTKRSVGNIKRRQVKSADVNIDKINYFAEPETVYQIPNCTAKKERHPDEKAWVNLFGRADYPYYAHQSNY